MAVCYLPGDNIDIPTLSSVEKKIIGYGIEQQEDGFAACQAGLLRINDNRAWLSVQSKRYIPQKGDRVLGVVSAKQGDLFKIDVGSADLAFVNFMSFEGATKRNRPNLKTGDLLYAQVIEASRHMEPELTCVDNLARARGMGVLNGGLLFKVSLHLARRVLSPSSQLMKILGKDFRFEITVGLNGKVWLNGQVSKELFTIRQLIIKSEYILECDIPEFLENEIRKAKGFVQMETDA